MTKRIDGGYALLPVPTLGQVLSLVRIKALTCFDVRVFLSLIELKDRRDAENACRRLAAAKPLDWVRFTKDELKRLLGAKCGGSVAMSLKRLDRAGVVSFDARSIKFITQAKCELLRSRRSMPLPRRILRYLVQQSKRSVVLTALSYLARGLFSHRGEITSSGRVKISFIEALTGLSRASVHRARQMLTDVGIILPGESKQWQLNRHGSFFSINILFENPNETSLAKVENSRFLIPRQSKKRRILIPPINKQKPSYEDKPKTLESKPWTGAQESKKKPDINNLSPFDIRRGQSLIVLYRQAISKKWFPDSRMNQINFVASAIKAVRKSQTPVRLFIWLIRNDFKYLSNADEDKALEVIAVIKRKFPDSFY